MSFPQLRMSKWEEKLRPHGDVFSQKAYALFVFFYQKSLKSRKFIINPIAATGFAANAHALPEMDGCKVQQFFNLHEKGVIILVRSHGVLWPKNPHSVIFINFRKNFWYVYVNFCDYF